MSFDDTLNSILEDHKRNNININNLPPITQPEQSTTPSNDNDLGAILPAFGIGLSNMVNDTVFGGLGYLAGLAGRGVEAVSPFSGSQDDDAMDLIRAGVPPEKAMELYPHEDSWITSLAKASLNARNYLSDNIQDWRSQVMGDNPSMAAQIAEGSGSSIGFMGLGLLASAAAATPGIGALIGALTKGGLESLSETGGQFADAYRAGLYDDGALSNATKSFVSNAILNTGLNYTVGQFNPKFAAIRNPITRFLAQTGGEVANEILQEPSQQTIERAAARDLYNNEDFLPALVDEAKEWPQTFTELLPSVAGSTLVTQLLTGGGNNIYTRQGRQNLYDQYRNRNVDLDETFKNLKQATDERDKIKWQLAKLQAGNSERDADIIKSLNEKTSALERNIADYSDKLHPYDRTHPELYTYNPAPYEGKISKVKTAGLDANTAFEVLEASDIITSTNDDGSVNEKYNQKYQPRVRGRDENMKEVLRIADNLDPELLGENILAQNGAPIIGKNDNMTLSGNGRVMALRTAYRQNSEKAQAYKKYLINEAEHYGLNPEMVKKMKNPVLVRRLLSDVDLEQFVREANQSSIQHMSDAELSKFDADSISGSILNSYDINKKVEDNTDALNAFLSTIPEVERNAYTSDDGGYSQNLIQRFRNAIIRKAYGDYDISSKMTEDTKNEGVNNVKKALYSLAPRIAKMNNGSVRSDLSISQDIKEALGKLIQYRKNEGKTDTEQNATEDFDIEGVKISPEAKTILDFFIANKHSAETIAQGLANYATIASGQDEEGKAVIDPDLNLSKMEILQRAFNGDGQQSTEQKSTNQGEEAQNTTDANMEQKLKPLIDKISAPDYTLDENDFQGLSDEEKNYLYQRLREKPKVTHDNQSQTQDELLNRIEPGKIEPAKAEKVAIPEQKTDTRLIHPTLKTKTTSYKAVLDEAAQKMKNGIVRENTKMELKSEQLRNLTEAEKMDLADIIFEGHLKKPKVEKTSFRYRVPTVRTDFSRARDSSLESPMNKDAILNPEKYNGYIGSLDVGIGENSDTAHLYFERDTKDGNYYVGVTDNDGNIVATYNPQNDTFSINPEQAQRGLSRRIEADFRREFTEGKNGKFSAAKLVERSFTEKAINAGMNEGVARASAKVYTAMNKYLARYLGRDLFTTAMSDNLSILSSSERKGKIRGESEFRAGKIDKNNNVLKEAQTIIRLFRNADQSTLLHETAHIFLEKLKRFSKAGLLDKGNNNQARFDWGAIKNAYGLTDIDFSKELSGKQLEAWYDAQEQFASGIENYFMTRKAPTSALGKAFNSFKEWLGNIYGSVRNIFYTDHRGIPHRLEPNEDVKKVFDNIFSAEEGYRDKSTFKAFDSDVKWNLDSEEGQLIYKQAGVNPKGYLERAIGKLSSWGKNIKDFFNIAHVARPSPVPQNSKHPFPGQIESEYTKAGEKIKPVTPIAKIKKFTSDVIKSIRHGDYSDLAESNNPDMIEAREMLRRLGRKKAKAVGEAMGTFIKNMKGLNEEQLEIFGKARMLDDLAWSLEQDDSFALPFGFTPEILTEQHERFKKLVDETPEVKKAIEDEEKTMRDINNEYSKWAGLLGLDTSGLFKNPHYYRHKILEYANATSLGFERSYAKGNIDLQEFSDLAMKEVLGRGWRKHRKGSELAFSTNYIQANSEVRAQMLQDIENMKTLVEIKKKFDKSPEILKKLKGKTTLSEDTVKFNQGEDDEIFANYFRNIPKGYVVFNPDGGRFIEGKRSVAENLTEMTAFDVSQATGVPLNHILDFMRTKDLSKLMVLPSGLAKTLARMAQARDRGALGRVAKELTTWWKKAVLFSPTRNLKYNLRNFSGDIDALIAGNPHALTHFKRAVSDLAAFYLKNGKEGFKADQDLLDYINRSAGLGIESLHLTAAEGAEVFNFLKNPTEYTERRIKKEKIASAIGDVTDKKVISKTLGAIKKAFQMEVEFTAFREHILRYAAYLDYKQQMERNKDGRPDNWGASLEDEVMSIKGKDAIKDRAFKMSNELLGAYDQVSEVGQELRRMLVPFYSWMEVNARRYYRLFKNGLTGKNQTGFVRRMLAGQTARIPYYAISGADAFAKIFLFTTLTQMFNRFVMPDADDDLPEGVKYRPHITFGKVNGQVYYFDRIGALADLGDWLSLDSIALDLKDINSGQQTLAQYMKKMMQAPISKAINGLNPGIKMPIELAMGRSMFPDVFHPSTIKDPAKYIAQSLGMSYPYKLATGEPHSTAEELVNLGLYSLNPDEAAYWQTLDKVRQYQNNVLDKHFDGFASTQRGRILQKLKLALRYDDKQKVREYLREYTKADGTKQGLKQSMKAMNPLHGLNEKEKKDFLKWLTPSDRKYLRKAERYWHQLADKYMK